LSYVNLNGKISQAAEVGIPVDNGSFRYGYGLFETMLIYNGAISLKQYHWERLFDGIKKLHFAPPKLMTAGWLEQQVLRTVEKNGLEELCRVRLQLFAGGGGLYSSDSWQPGILIECFPLESDLLSLNENGLVVGIADGLSKSVDTLCNLKSCSALIYAVAARQASEQKWNDALIKNTKDNIIESTLANIFWIKQGAVYTPPLSDGCVAGVMRRHIMDKTTIAEKSLSLDELLNADEVFLTNAIKKMRWVSRVNDTHYTNAATISIFNKLMSIQ
jgi:branched-chain amino acid aminotransferase